MTFKELRETKNISQRKLAQKIGVTSNAVNQYERGKRIPSLIIVSEIAAALDVSIETVVACFMRKKGE